jgi:hypothetical protein
MSSSPSYPPRQNVPGLTDTTAIRWDDDGLASIDAPNTLDALTALGYVHGLKRGWTVTLWRQTALGQLSRWFGTGLVPLDRHVRTLGLAQQAQAAVDRLPAPDRRRLQAYSRGLNAALQSTRVREQDPFVLLDVQPAPWAPWHTLAVERLLAWIATGSLDAPPDAPPSVTAFQDADATLRRWLHLHGWERSLAWAVRPNRDRDTTHTALFQRHVLGAVATPLVQEVTINRPGAGSLTAATLPGLPLLPTGVREGKSWASLLQSPARLVRAPLDSAALTRRYERIEPANGDEQLVQIERLEEALFLGPASVQDSSDSTLAALAPPDTEKASPRRPAWVVRWPGLHANSDLPAWLQRAGLRPPSADSAVFSLFSGDGLRVDPSGGWSILGTPSVVVQDSAHRRILVGNAEWAHQQARALGAYHEGSVSPAVGRWSTSDSSAWAGTLLSGAQPALRMVANTAPSYRNAVTYLRNWDHVYAPSSIGATIFDRWMRSYRRDLGRVPTAADTAAYFATYREHSALRRALDSLRARFGPDVRRWRWERAVADRRFFPVWSADSLVESTLEDLSTTRYAPLSRTGHGHPSAPAGGPSLVDPAVPAPAPTAWDGWTTPAGSTLVVRRHHYDPTAFFARSRMRQTHPAVVPLPPDSAVAATILLHP